MLAIITSHPIQYQAPLWRAMAAAGLKFEVWFLTPHALKDSFDREFGQSFAWDVDLLAGYPHRFLDIEPGWRLDKFNGIRLRRSWREELAGRGITHLWVEGWRFGELWRAVRAARAGGIEVWLRGENHDLAPEPPWPRRLVKRLALGWLFRRVDCFLQIGSANARFYRRHGVAPEKMRPAPYCVDNDYFTAQAARWLPERAALRRGWRIADDAFCVLFCGKLIAKKRPADLVAAVRSLRGKSARPMHLLLAGSGELAAALQADLGPETLATFAGFLNQSEVTRAFVAADCLVLPSDFGETWGLVVNEALACGLPTIVSDHCGCAEDLAAPQGAAHVFPCGNTTALADSLLHVAAHPPSAALLRTLSESHAIHRTVQSITNLLTSTQPTPHHE
jgi:glycosyltransferase involved in cell wall biosynthesis